jgi:hypothetical protein
MKPFRLDTKLCTNMEAVRQGQCLLCEKLTCRYMHRVSHSSADNTSACAACVASDAKPLTIPQHNLCKSGGCKGLRMHTVSASLRKSSPAVPASIFSLMRNLTSSRVFCRSSAKSSLLARNCMDPTTPTTCTTHLLLSVPVARRPCRALVIIQHTQMLSLKTPSVRKHESRSVEQSKTALMQSLAPLIAFSWRQRSEMCAHTARDLCSLLCHCI